MIRIAAFVVALLLLTGKPAHADLIDLGNGMIYDSLQNLTWLQDTHYARTSGDDPDGWLSHSDAVQWTENLVFGGFDDWRLPNRTFTDALDHSSEISTLLTQLGWHWPSFGEVEVGGVGPFLNFFDTRDNGAAIPMYWLSAPGTIFNMIFVFDFRDDIPDNTAGVWAVRDGNPTARVPEPSTLLLLGIGVAAAQRLRRKLHAH